MINFLIIDFIIYIQVYKLFHIYLYYLSFNVMF